MTEKILHGTKFDSEKPRFDLIPPDTQLAIAKVLAHGAKKYADNNWLGLKVNRVIAALERHLNAIKSGEDIDVGDGCNAGSGMPHSWHMLTNAIFLVHLLEHYPDQDDRHFKYINKKKKETEHEHSTTICNVGSSTSNIMHNNTGDNRDSRNNTPTISTKPTSNIESEIRSDESRSSAVYLTKPRRKKKVYRSRSKRNS
jgi:hypothetical protein